MIGTLYKQKSREEAILRGLDFFGPKMRAIIDQVVSKYPSAESSIGSKLIINCWRGGMRSAGVAWILDLYGFDVSTLSGGYKSYRRWVMGYLDNPFSFRILGGYTGSQKTRILRCMRERNLSLVLDLEELASHRGSAFGGYGLPFQPSQEMFENKIAYELYRLCDIDGIAARNDIGQTIWVEDESQRIGKVNLPASLWNHMRTRSVLFIDVSFEERLENILTEYGGFDSRFLTDAIQRISKRLGGHETKTCLGLIERGDMRGAFAILLKYYDKTYDKALKNRPESTELIRLTVTGKTVDEVADLILNI